MHPVSVTGSPRFRFRLPGLLILPTLAALGGPGILAGCGGGGSGAKGTGGRTDAGNSDARDGATGTGGRGSGGTLGTGGAPVGTGGAIMGTGGVIMGTGGATPPDGSTSDASDGPNVCADAGLDAGGPGDSDNDGVPDCLDGCPFDTAKTSPGQCGCYFADTDSDTDGVADCLDPCPHDNRPIGACGCQGIPASTPMCLVHRYSFDDTTATIADSITITGVSPANGTAVGATPAGGRIVLAGGANSATGQHVSLPAHIVSTLGINATFEAWVTWNPVVPTTSGPWQRVFDFGSSDMGPGLTGGGVTYIFLSPFNGGNSRARAAITLGGGGAAEDLTDSPAALPVGAQAHVAVVVNGTNRLMTLYVNGVVSGTPVTLRASNVLSQLDDVNNWLGRSQWSGDQLFAGSISEFRIYSRALNQSEVAASFAAGPDQLPGPSDGGTSDGGTSDAVSTPDGGAGDTPDAPAGG